MSEIDFPGGPGGTPDDSKTHRFSFTVGSEPPINKIIETTGAQPGDNISIQQVAVDGTPLTNSTVTVYGPDSYGYRSG